MIPHRPRHAGLAAFSLIELLTVIAIIAVLMSLIFSAAGSVKEASRRVQAKHDVRQLVASINAYCGEYGVYPIKRPPPGEATEVTFTTDNSALIYTLCAVSQGANEGNILNPKQVGFLEVPRVKDPLRPRSGQANGIWYDPWGPQPGKPESGIYHVRLDGTYSNVVSDPYPGDRDGADKDDDMPEPLGRR